MSESREISRPKLRPDACSGDRQGPSYGVRLARELHRRAAALGLDQVGIARADAIPQAGSRLDAFLADGRHGDMDWLETTADRRRRPTALWPEARSVIMVGHNYGPGYDPMDALNEQDRGVISVYAQGRDYHGVLKGRIKQLAGWLASEARTDVKVFVDTAPLMEKPLAEAAGIGWQGKHTNVVSRSHGSWLFLGAILTNAELPPDEPEQDHCGSCRRCLDICPTAAFPAPYQLDARRCIAYLTIEHKGHIAREFRKPIGNRVFGCDDCLAVCPWNKFAQTSNEARYAAQSGNGSPPIAELLALDDAAFRVRFAGTPVKRTGRDRVVRNALIAAGNSKNPDYIDHCAALLEDESPLVRAMAVWAIAQLAGPDRFRRLRGTHLPRERDVDVRREWEETDAAPAVACQDTSGTGRST